MGREEEDYPGALSSSSRAPARGAAAGGSVDEREREAVNTSIVDVGDLLPSEAFFEKGTKPPNSARSTTDLLRPLLCFLVY